MSERSGFAVQVPRSLLVGLLVRAIPIAMVVLALVGCGSSSSANSVRYTVTPKSGFGAGITVQFSGPAAPTRLVFNQFEASRAGDYVSASSATGPKNCAVSAGGGKVTITVYGSNPLAGTLCTAITGRF